MNMSTVASTALTLALSLAMTSLPTNPLIDSSAHALGLTQSAPGARSTQRSTRTPTRPPRAAQGLAPSPYFDRGTRVPLASPSVRQRPRNHVNQNRHRHENRRRDYQRIDVSRPQAGSIGLRRGSGSVGNGPAITQTQRTTPRRIDRRMPHANRDTSGISFWPKRRVSSIPRTAALRAPQFPYAGPRPGTRAMRLGTGAQTFTRHGASWHFSSGHWYRPHRLGGFVVVLPPIGLALPFLPTGSEEIYYEGQRYYVAGGVTLRQAEGEYLVVNAPEINTSDRGYYIAALDQIAEPVKGQSESRFGRDVDRCAGRAEARSGYDPEREDASRAAERRYEAFSRSLSRCLQTAGYSLY